MTPSITIELSGTLGERHCRLNASVHDAYQQNTSFQSILNHPEVSPTDRLFKIDLASKQRNVDYIIHTLKDDDMLYVSRALKSLWLLETEYSNIISPKFLEHELVTQMTLQAANKMRHWIRMHLRDSQRCEEFYQFYKSKDFDIAAKYLWHCSGEFVVREVADILDKITPKLLKVLSEKVPQVTKIYYENLKENQDVLKYYLNNDTKFLSNVKYLLKPRPDVFFYVLENFVSEKFNPFNTAISEYIMKHHKNRFMEKPELYTARFLNMNAIAKCLSSEEIKELVVKLAKAKYLNDWFSYKTVEPLIKRLSGEDRTAFKKFVFVDKAFGPTVEKWPYPIPVPPELIVPQKSLFEDARVKGLNGCQMKLRRCDVGGGDTDFRMMLKKRKCAKWTHIHRQKTLLDELFDKYRFSNYKQTLLELRKRLRTESSARNRQYMLLVLVSKTGGRLEDMASLFDLLSQYKNEPVQIRAAIVRSLVKRAFAWRLTPEYWAKLLEWGHGLGLDGSAPEAACCEGLHAVVIRDFIAGVTPQDPVWKAFLGDFSTLAEYSLSVEERNYISVRLSASLLAAAQSNPEEAVSRLNLLLDTLDAYHIRYDNFPGTVEAIAATAERDLQSASHLLRRLYKAGVARRRLIRENFEIMQTDESYLNALRHDVSMLDKITNIKELIDTKKFKHEKFLRKLSLYFTEKGGLGERYRAVLELRAATTPDIILARPLALLAGSNFPLLLKKFDAASPKTPQRRLAAALRSNFHVVRPVLDLDSFGWRAAGAKAVTNRVVACKPKDVERYLVETLSWSRTLRLALVLAKRVGKTRDAYEVFSSKRPYAALISVLLYIKREGGNADLRFWDIVKTHIPKLSEIQLKRVIKLVPSGNETSSSNDVVRTFSAECWVLLYKAYKKNSKNVYMKLTFLSVIPEILPEADEEFIFGEIEEFLSTCFADSAKNATLNINEDYDKCDKLGWYTGIIARFLVLSNSEEMSEKRLQKVGIPFFVCIERIWKKSSKDVEYFLDSLLLHLRYNRAYFDVKYASCLTVFERLVEWMHGFLPIAIWFDKYCTVHLTMMYFKTVRHCLGQNPNWLSDEPKKLKDAPEILGTVFGEFISKEIEVLTQRYFPSITELYGAEIVNYFRRYFYRRGRHYDESVQKFTTAAVIGLMTNKTVASCILAKHVFMGLRDRLKSKQCDDIIKSFMETEIEELSFDFDDFM